MRGLGERLKVVAVIVVVIAATFFAIRQRYGAYGDYYYVSVDIPRATQLLRVGTDVRESGVLIGTVSDLRLVGPQHVQMVLEIEREYPIPQDAHAFVDLKTLLGDKFVDVRFDRFEPPFLEDGARIPGTAGPELEDVVQSGVDVLEAIDPADAATIVSELARGARGDDIARGLRSGAELSGVFADTVRPQLQSLRDFRVLFGELSQRAPDLNLLADAINEGAPVYASESAQQDLHRALVGAVVVANHLGDLFQFEREDWDRMIVFGDRVLQAVAERPRGLRSLVNGLGVYVRTLGGQPPGLFDGSAMAPFANFTGGTSFEETIVDLCGAVPPEERELIPICAAVEP